MVSQFIALLQCYSLAAKIQLRIMQHILRYCIIIDFMSTLLMYFIFTICFLKVDPLFNNYLEISSYISEIIKLKPKLA